MDQNEHMQCECMISTYNPWAMGGSPTSSAQYFTTTTYK